MKKLTSLAALLCIGLLLPTACKKKPTNNIKLNINADIIKYTAYINISDITDGTTVPSNIHFSVSGDDAQYVYEISGKKDFKVNNGNITIGLAPSRTPATGAPVVFTIRVSADGYLPVMKQVSINAGQTTQSLNVKMINYTNPPVGTNVKTATYAMSGGTLADNAIATISRTTDTDYYSGSAVAVVLPTGTTFTYDSVYTPVIGRKSYYLPTGNVPFELPDVVGKTDVKRGVYHGSHLQVVIYFTSAFSNTALQTYDVSGGSDNSSIHLLNGSSAPYTHLFLTGAAKAKVLGIHFIGIDDNGGAIELYPSEASNWYISWILDNSIFNPQTNALIKEGDLIETGVDYAHDSTIIGAIQKDPLGNLRVKTRSLEVGYYSEAASVVNFNYQVNTTIDSNVIPDPENLYANIIAAVVTGSQGSASFTEFSADIPVNAGIFTFSKNVCSQTAYTLASPDYVVEYFDAEEVIQDPPTYQASYFGNGITKKLYAPIDFSFSLSCAQSNKVIYPSLYFGVEQANGAKFICHVVNGKWKTRGLKPDTYNFSGYYSGMYVGGDPITVKAGHNDIAVKTDDGICNLFK